MFLCFIKLTRLDATNQGFGLGRVDRVHQSQDVTEQAVHPVCN